MVKDNVDKVFKSMTKLMGQQVLIGFPDDGTRRDDGAINNASLAYIHEFGSPTANIPARPFLIPGVDKIRTPAADILKQAADASLKGDDSQTDQLLHRVGILGMDSAKEEIQSGTFAPLKPATIANRSRQRGDKSKRTAETHYAELISGGMSPEAAQTAAGIRPLINTGELRNAITFVVKKKD